MQDIELTSTAALWDWFAQNHGQSESVRLVTWKAAHPKRYISREEVLDALIAHGWIDGRRFTVDADRTAQLVSPRRQQAWAQSYKTRVEALRRAGRMQPAGEAAVAAGQASGLWDFYADVDALIVPEDLGQGLDRGLDRGRWDSLPASYRRNVLRWIKQAKTPATRSKRINAAVAATAKGDRLPQM